MTATTEKAKFTWQAAGPIRSHGQVTGRNFNRPWPDATVTWTHRGKEKGWKIHLYWPGSDQTDVGLPADELLGDANTAKQRTAARRRAQELLTMLEPEIRKLHEKLAFERKLKRLKEEEKKIKWDREQALKRDMLDALNRRYPELEIEPSHIPLEGTLEVVDLGRLSRLLSRLDPA